MPRLLITAYGVLAAIVFVAALIVLIIDPSIQTCALMIGASSVIISGLLAAIAHEVFSLVPLEPQP